MAKTPSHRLTTSSRAPKVEWRHEILRLLPLAALYAAVELLLRLSADSGRMQPVQTWTAMSAQWLLGLFGLRTVLAGCAVVTSAGTVRVDGLCLPITPLAVGVALIACETRMSAARKALWILVIVVALMLVSVGRIALIAFLVESGSPLMGVMHETITPIIWLAVPVLVWLLALRRSQDDPMATS